MYTFESISHRVFSQQVLQVLKICTCIYRANPKTCLAVQSSARRMGGGFRVVKTLLKCGKRSSIFPSEESSMPEGQIRVVVGKAKSEEAVVEMEAHYLNHPLVEKVLSLTREEYGYSYEGALRISCDIHLFRYLLQQLDGRNPSAHYMDLPDLISKFSKASNGSH